MGDLLKHFSWVLTLVLVITAFQAGQSLVLGQDGVDNVESVRDDAGEEGDKGDEAAPDRQSLTKGAFFRSLLRSDLATFGDAVHITYILVKNTAASEKIEEGSDYDTRLAALVDMGIVPKQWRIWEPTWSVSRGELAMMLYRGLKIRGGITLMIFGVNQRYAYLECVDKHLLRGGNQWATLTGAALMDVLSVATTFRDRKMRATLDKAEDDAMDEYKGTDGAPKETPPEKGAEQGK